MVDLTVSESRVESRRTNKGIASKIGEPVWRDAARKQCDREFVEEVLQISVRTFRQPESSVSTGMIGDAMSLFRNARQFRQSSNGAGTRHGYKASALLRLF